MLLKAPINTIKFANRKLNSNLKMKATKFIVIACPKIPIHLRLTYVILLSGDDFKLLLNSIN